MAYYLEGRYLNDFECLFLEKVDEDLKVFSDNLKPESILVFPPWISSCRYLVHKFVDKYFFPDLCSFSIGLDDERRVIVGTTRNIFRCCLPYSCVHQKQCFRTTSPDCICDIRVKILFEYDATFASSMASYEGYDKVKHFVCSGSSMKMSEVKDKNRGSMKERHKRPDKQLYVPRALRKVGSESLSQSKQTVNFHRNCSFNDIENRELSSVTSENGGPLSLRICDQIQINLDYTGQYVDKMSESSIMESQSTHITDISIKTSENNIATTKSDNTQVMINKSLENPGRNYPESIQNFSDNSIMKSEKIILPCEASPDSSNNVNIVEKLENDSEICDKSAEKNIYLQPCKFQEKDCGSEIDISVASDSWETLFNDDGECLDPKILKELHDITGRMQISVAKNDYSEYQPVNRSASEEYSNIVELSGFPVEFNTQDLTSAFSMFQEASYSLKWVDDSHALAVFTSPVIANQALYLKHPFIKVRPLSEGIKESKEKAKFCKSLWETPKPRPATTAVLARRLVTGALGLKVHTSKEQRDLERSILKEAREKKKLKAKQRQDIWDGIDS